MCSVAAASIAAVVGSAISGGVQNERNLKAQGTAAAENASRMDAARADAQFRGNVAAGQVQQQYGAAEAAQRTAMASSGLAAGSGSYQGILSGTAQAKSYEEANAYANAAREALGYSREAADYRAQQKAIDKERIWNVANTLVGGSSQVASVWNQQKARKGN